MFTFRSLDYLVQVWKPVLMLVQMPVATRTTVMKLCRLDAMLAQINHSDQATLASCLNQNGACFPAVTNALPVRHVSFIVKADQLLPVN